MIAVLWLLPVLLFGASLLATRSATRRVERAAQWLRADGQIVASQIRANSNGTYTPEISYAYMVGGEGYASDRLRPGGTPFFYSEGKAMALAGQYPAGTPITVHHDPRRPRRAAIELVPMSHWVLPLRVLALATLALAALVTVSG